MIYLYHIDNITKLSVDLLHKLGIHYLVLDFDGVLASYGKTEINNDIFYWFNNFITEFSQSRIFIFSNKPTEDRLKYFNNHFPDIRFIYGVAKKPYPEGLNKIISLTNCQVEELAFVDDRLLTGCLSCVIIGCYPIFVTNPYIDNTKHRKKEKFFKFLRYVEKKIFLNFLI